MPKRSLSPGLRLLASFVISSLLGVLFTPQFFPALGKDQHVATKRGVEHVAFHENSTAVFANSILNITAESDIVAVPFGINEPLQSSGQHVSRLLRRVHTRRTSTVKRLTLTGEPHIPDDQWQTYVCTGELMLELMNAHDDAAAENIVSRPGLEKWKGRTTSKFANQADVMKYGWETRGQDSRVPSSLLFSVFDAAGLGKESSDWDMREVEHTKDWIDDAGTKQEVSTSHVNRRHIRECTNADPTRPLTVISACTSTKTAANQQWYGPTCSVRGSLLVETQSFRPSNMPQIFFFSTITYSGHLICIGPAPACLAVLEYLHRHILVFRV